MHFENVECIENMMKSIDHPCKILIDNLKRYLPSTSKSMDKHLGNVKCV